MTEKEKLYATLNEWTVQLRETEELQEPKEKELYPLYEAIMLMKRSHEAKLREIRAQAAERDAFYSEVHSIRAEHHTAEQIQRSLLPDSGEAFRESHGVDLFADMDTAWEVGGDYYDYFPLDRDRIFFSIGDVAGKGVPASIFCVTAKTMIEEAILNGREMEDVFGEVSRRLYLKQKTVSRLFVTLWAGIYDRRDGKISFVNAGHDSPFLIRRDGSIEEVSVRSGMPVAAYYSEKKKELCTYTASSLHLERGDTLLLYTDGLTDTRDENGERYGAGRLSRRLEEGRVWELEAGELVTFLERGVDTYGDRGERDDDITLLALRRL